MEAGNPADSERFLLMLKRHIGSHGEAPRQTAANGGFASRQNLGEAKAIGVRDVVFHKKAGLRIMDVVKSNWVYRKLRNFRAGIESDISRLKRAYGLAYVWSSALAYNLALLKPATPPKPSPAMRYPFGGPNRTE
jgi:IS5 family transposase